MIVSEALAKKAWPNEDPIGKRIGCCEGSPTDPRWKTVIGVAADVRSSGPTVDVQPEFYIPLDQAPPHRPRPPSEPPPATGARMAKAASGDRAAARPPRS